MLNSNNYKPNIINGVVIIDEFTDVKDIEHVCVIGDHVMTTILGSPETGSIIAKNKDCIIVRYVPSDRFPFVSDVRHDAPEVLLQNINSFGYAVFATRRARQNV